MKKPDLSIENVLSIKKQIGFDRKISMEILEAYILFFKKMVESFCRENREDQEFLRRCELLKIATEHAEYLLAVARQSGFYDTPIKERVKILENFFMQNEVILQECSNMYFQESNSNLEMEKIFFDVVNYAINYAGEKAIVSEKERAKIISNSMMAALTENQFSKVFIEGVNDSKKGNAKRGASTINSQHKDRQDYVYKWLDANYKDGDTHEDLASRLEPLLDGERKYGTILKDISKWKKERGVIRKR